MRGIRTSVRLRGNLRPPGGPELQILEVGEGATVDDLIALLGLRPGDVWLAMLDGQPVEADRPLRPGDELSLIPPVGGGA
jgi:molybdopterin converting factor small subunit